MTPDKIYLVGFMASGKSTVARALAARLDWQFEDVDDLIERRERLTIADVFARHGEAYFRGVEREILRLVQPLRHVVVATGGGTFADADNRALIALDGVSVWLDVALVELIPRIPLDGRRPLAANRADLERLYAARLESYRLADVHLHVSSASVEATVDMALDALQRTSAVAGGQAAFPDTMRYLILSDLHANLQALDAVLEDAQAVGYDAVLVLGDLVGYGADPAAVIDRTLALEPAAMIRGNHDKVCSGLESPMLFNDAARASAEWTAQILGADHRAILQQLPKGPQLVTGEIEICHGTPFDEDHYVFDDHDASRAADAASGRICLFGHTHVPAIYATPQEPVAALDGSPDELQLPKHAPVLINVGSVGQPRDGDPRAAYGILDDERGVLRLRRVPYDIATAQANIIKAKLPEWLALRLERGQNSHCNEPTA